jgi:uroporphyrinogen-III synthase
MPRSPGVWVTRPQEQAGALCQRIEALGWHAIPFPAIAIESLRPAPAPRASDYDLLLFVSRNAVLHGLPQLGPIPASVRIGSVGNGTASQLREQGLTVQLVPEANADSEGLLAIPALRQVAGARVLILRGEGGRPLLGDALRERGARVDYAEVYRRRLPAADVGPVLRQWPALDLVLVTSNEVLDHLEALLGPRAQALLGEKWLLTVSRRGLEHARARGYRRLLLAEGASDAALVSAMLAWAEGDNLRR